MQNIEHSYLSLPKKFYSLVKPELFSNLKIIKINQKFCKEHKIDPSYLKNKIHNTLSHHSNSNLFAQAYSGHQFGYFTNLGDGRAMIFSEYINKNNERFDIQLKGAGKTQYSRGGDGKATLKSILREYLIGEAMNNLNIPSSRGVAIIKSGEKIQRNTSEHGGILVRSMKSHIRVGTFEYASYFGSINDLKTITSYTISRLFPKVNISKNPAIYLLKQVMIEQINLVVNWMRVGFIHGVMNTDNTSISGESFDYGPCAFLNTYNPLTVYSSIDYNGRYAFGNQPNTIKWNIIKFAEALLPIINTNKKNAIKIAQSTINEFDDIWKKTYYNMMLKKIGIKKSNKKSHILIDQLLNIMIRNKMDFTNTFSSLSENNLKSKKKENSDFEKWKQKWSEEINLKEAKKLMKKNNPIFIPRNHLVEESIEMASNGDYCLFNEMLEVLSCPYENNDNLKKFKNPPNESFEKCFKTYCGT